MPTATFTRYFTPTEANELLPGMAATLAEVADGMRDAQALAAVASDADDDEDRRVSSRMLEQVLARAQDLLHGIEQLGVHVKGIEPALLDFPALRNGQEVYLCWREGEAVVTWWHPVHLGIVGRKLIEPDNNGCWEWCN